MRAVPAMHPAALSSVCVVEQAPVLFTDSAGALFIHDMPIKLIPSAFAYRKLENTELDCPVATMSTSAWHFPPLLSMVLER
jgi:hypothetical protein